ncbi:MAG: hypothetical protein WC707_01255 [Candidatus Babeliaceae bacterium]|jgi:hypothetical protein
MVKNSFLGALVQSWRESLSLLAPKNSLKILALTLKTYTQMWRALITGAWWFLLLVPIIFFATAIITFGFGVTQPSPSYFSYILLMALFHGLIQFFLLCAMRPSVSLKNVYYFFKQLKLFFFFYLYFLIGLAPAFRFGFFTMASYSSAFVIFMVFETLAGLFLLDSGGRLVKVMMTWWRALKMIVYNAPILMALLAVFGLSTYGYFASTGFLLRPLCESHNYNFSAGGCIASALFASIFYVLCLAAFFMCLLTNLYTMWIHQQFKFYYDEK